MTVPSLAATGNPAIASRIAPNCQAASGRCPRSRTLLPSSSAAHSNSGNLYFPGDGCPASAPVIHTGVDLAAPEGTPFFAASSGWVTLADYDRPTADANTRIIIQHDGRNEGYATDYLHWIASYVEEGDYVRAGEPIGEVGSVGYSTGPHLHFSVTDLDTGEHVDPMRWLPEESAPDDFLRQHATACTTTSSGRHHSRDILNPPIRPRRRRRFARTYQNPHPTTGANGTVPNAVPARSARSAARLGTTMARRKTMPRPNRIRIEQKRTAKDEPTASSTGDEPTDEPGVKERERRRERNKDGTDTETTDSGEDGTKRRNADESSADESTEDGKRRDRDEPGESGGEDKSGGGGKSDQDDRNNNKGDDSGGRGGRDGKDGKDGKDGPNGGAGEDGGDGEPGENGGDGEDGGNGGNGGNGGDGDSGGNGGDGGGGGNGGEDGTGGNGGDGGDGGDGAAGDGGDGGDGGSGGSGSSGSDGGDGGDGGDSAGDPEGDGTRGGDGGTGGAGGAGTG